jgi:hypothetical protein
VAPVTGIDRLYCIRRISDLPTRLRALVRRIERPRTTAGHGWSVVGLLHHAADQHLHDYMCMKRMLTSDRPHLSAWNWRALAALPDAREAPVDASLALLQGLHLRWTMMLASLDEAGWQRTGVHDAYGEVTIERLLAESARQCDELLARFEALAAAERREAPPRRRAPEPLGMRLVAAFGLAAEARAGG